MFLRSCMCPTTVSLNTLVFLVAAGHAPSGKAYYHALCQRLVQRGYVVISWDPIGQGERSQFWDAKTGKSRYNLICAEHAVLGNLAYLAGTNLARWEIWDGIRAVDYLLTRSEVDPERISITGSSGGGFQAAHIAALDRRIKVAVPSCYFSSLPMRMYNRIFKDPDSDPEQDLYGMMSNHVDHAGLLLMMYPRPVLVAAAVLDFFPIEGTHKTVREVSDIYGRFQHADRIGITEGYHEHQFSLENQERALDFLDHFNGMPTPERTTAGKGARREVIAVHSYRPGDARLRRRAFDHGCYSRVLQSSQARTGKTIEQLYHSDLHPHIETWKVAEFHGAVLGDAEIAWEKISDSQYQGVTIEKYLLRHSRYLQMPLLRIHKTGKDGGPVLLWLGENGKVMAADWPAIVKYVEDGYSVLSFDPRGLGETRMPYKAASPDDPSLAQLDLAHAYLNPLSGVLSDYVYNSLLVGRPYLLQTIEDTEIATHFLRAVSGPRVELFIAGSDEAAPLVSAITQTLPDIKLLPHANSQPFHWSEVVEQKTEIWPIQYLLPGGAYIH